MTDALLDRLAKMRAEFDPVVDDWIQAIDDAAAEITRLRALAAPPAAPPVPATLGALMAVTAQCNRLKVALELACSHLTDAQAAEVAAAMPPEDAAAAQPVPATGAQPWQPIETAPKNCNTAVLVHCQHGMYVAEWREHDIEYWHVDDNKHGPFPLRGAAPTHWMPLPTAPTGSATAPGQSKHQR